MNASQRVPALILSGFVGALVSVSLSIAPFAYLPGVQGAAEQRAVDMGVTIVVTNDARNCGAQESWTGVGGCFDTSNPDVIYVSPWADANGLEYVTLHELAHRWMFVNGQDSTDECRADLIAASWGAAGPFHYCGPR